jgi:hypothetical protein
VDLKLLKRRAEMLDAVSIGLHPADVVGQLAEKPELKKSCNFRGLLSVDTVSRRLELLKLEGLGFSQAEIVKELSVKLKVVARSNSYILEPRACLAGFCRGFHYFLDFRV